MLHIILCNSTAIKEKHQSNMHYIETHHQIHLDELQDWEPPEKQLSV